MKKDWKLYVAVLLIIAAVVMLIFTTLDRKREVDNIINTINQLNAKQTQPQQVNAPVLGVDYFNGKDASDEQVQKAVDKYMATHPTKEGNNGINGKDGDSGMNAYELAVVNGFTGTLDQWLQSQKVKGDPGEPASELQIDCMDGKLAKKYSTDAFWQLTNIKCEIEHE